MNSYAYTLLGRMNYCIITRNRITKLGLPKSSSELLTIIYQGREDELFRMLQLMECKHTNNQITIEIISLISELELSKSVYELLST